MYIYIYLTKIDTTKIKLAVIFLLFYRFTTIVSPGTQNKAFENCKKHYGFVHVFYKRVFKIKTAHI